VKLLFSEDISNGLELNIC